MRRYAIVRHAFALTVKAYLPKNYDIIPVDHGQRILIGGTDSGVFTLERVMQTLNRAAMPTHEVTPTPVHDRFEKMGTLPAGVSVAVGSEAKLTVLDHNEFGWSAFGPEIRRHVSEAPLFLVLA